MRALAALLLLIASCAPALATIKVCNQFSHPIHLAFAYEAKGGWVSDGWLTVAPNACEIDTRHPDMTSFFYRAESDTYDDNKWTTWGSDREFDVKDGNFQQDHAESKAPGARWVKFNGPDTYTDPFTVVTLTFLPDLKVTFSVPNENAGARPSGGGPASPPVSTHPSESIADVDASQDPDFETCRTAHEDEAASACNRAIASGKFKGSDLAAIYNNRGAEQQDKRLAIADYTKAIELDPNNPKSALFYENRGKSYTAIGDYGRAISDLTKAIQLNPGRDLTYSLRGWAYQAKNDRQHALADYSKAIELNPQDASTYVNRGRLYFDKGDLTQAMADFDKAIELNPNLAMAYCNRGVLFSVRNDNDRAIASYSKAIELDPNLALAYANRAIAEEKVGNKNAAIADYRRATELDPNDEDSKRALKRLQGFYVDPREKVR